MPNILQSLIPSFGGKTVFVTTQDGTEVFAAAQFTKVEIKPESRPMEHPVESGATITDHRILLPIEIELATVLSSQTYKDVYKEIASLYGNGTLLTVQSRAGVFTNQLIQAIPHTEDAEQYDAIIMSLKLKQVLIATTPTVSTGSVANTNPVKGPISPTNESTVDVGQVGDHAPSTARTADGRARLAKYDTLTPGR